MGFGIDLAKGAATGAVGSTVNGAIGYGIEALTRKQRMQAQYDQAKKLQELQMDGQKKLNQENARLNHEYAMKMWNDTNAPAQVELYKKAGLNVGLMYGGGGSGGTTQGAGTASGNVGLQGAETPSTKGMGMNMTEAASIDLMKANAEKARAEAKKIEGVDTEVANMDKIIKEFTGKELKDFYENVSQPNRGVQSKTYQEELEARQATASTIYEMWKEGKLKEKSDAEVESILLQNAKSKEEAQEIRENIELIKQNTQGKSLDNIITEIETKWAETLGLKSGNATEVITKVLGMLMKKPKNVPVSKTNKK